ncbi:alpha-amylase family protein [Leptolyngbya sp. FACHB-541]|uniref:alpha-amylase n=1 Tax=Leptolyngbya sp. FACHB-541 TaxID=2692810 RepID=UPI00168A280C|nr:alpha-amylase family protein [Leptolyngbya sp. FACHB-541]MBD2000951.1 alpha-amylase family protein [Leptolyngbya sp. FACHB-541]
MLRKFVYGLLFLIFLVIPLIGSVWRIDTDSVEEAIVPRTAFVHLFEWKWEDVAQECESFLGPKGFAAVQISPPNEHAVIAKQSYPWWQRYQPVSYQIKSRSGDRTQFTNMVERCRAAGVDVYADAVINHMSGELSGKGSAGSIFTKYHYPGLYESRDFHSCRQNIQDYRNHEQVTSCELSGLPDLKTSSSYVRSRIAEYLIDLVNLGVAGFRIDAAKHINTKELGAILSLVQQSVTAQPYILQEVIDPGTEAVRKSEYYSHGDVYEFEYGRLVGAKFLGLEGQSLSQLDTLSEEWGLAPSDKAIVFIDNHDKQRGHGGGGTYLTYKNGKLYELANVFMLAHPYGYPDLMSSYKFSNSEQGPPADADGNTHSVYHNGEVSCFEEWQCEHRWQAIANMVSFRNHTSAEPLTHWWSNGANQIAFSRGNKGFVVINRESTPLNHTFQTDMAPGTYCNVIEGELNAEGTGCTATGANATVTVDRHKQITLSVDGMGAIAIHAGTKVS